jgi:hypothetical protein
MVERHWPRLLEWCSPARTANRARTKGELHDLAPLLTLADAHGVAAQLVAALNLHKSSIAEMPAWLQAVLASLQRRQLLSITLTAELFRVLDLLHSSGIDVAVVKGPVLSVRAFGDPSIRQYGDIDVVLRHAQIASASKTLAAAGFHARVSTREIQAGKIPGQYLFRRPKSGVIIELHTERTLRYFPRPLPIEDFFQRMTHVSFDGRNVPALALEDEFVLICIHGAKHFWERLMWISDVAAIAHCDHQLDWSRVRHSATAVGAERMVRVALLLSERLLGVPLPPEMKREVAADSACLPMAKKIESWLPYAGAEPPHLAQRALFRFRMRGRLFAGARYLTRLSLSTTEEDWDDSESPAFSLGETLRRPFRLAKKYRKPT